MTRPSHRTLRRLSTSCVLATMISACHSTGSNSNKGPTTTAKATVASHALRRIRWGITAFVAGFVLLLFFVATPLQKSDFVRGLLLTQWAVLLGATLIFLRTQNVNLRSA